MHSVSLRRASHRGRWRAPRLGNLTFFVTALDTDGTVEWTTQDGSSGDDRGAAITIDDAGRLLVVGHTNGRLSSGPAAGGTDVFIITLDPTAALLTGHSWAPSRGTAPTTMTKRISSLRAGDRCGFRP
ncbi:hypothetical protein E3T46_00925 [Cryobacterium sp. Hh11]|nr:hypothetical protein E3T46_00925 [Cryobacterium sp. Hh11]